jgi:hypothetical protein
MFSGATLEINLKKILGKIFGATRRKENAARWSGVHGG